MEAVTSLELGADDYVRLPCDLTELTTRIWALMRRAGTAATYETENPLTSGHLIRIHRWTPDGGREDSGRGGRELQAR